MKNMVVAVLILAALPGLGRGETVVWSEIGKSVKIVGRLGVPLGNIVRIEATLVSKSDLPNPQFDPRLNDLRFLRVESVDGARCEDRPVMHFVVDAGPMDEYPRESDKAPHAVEKRWISSLEKAALGTTFTLYAFESGDTPINPNDGSPDVGFQFTQMMPEPDPKANPHFRIRLHVLEPRSQPDQVSGPATPSGRDSP